MPVGGHVTLRRTRMYDFLDRLIHIALPRVRDFRGLNPRSFDLVVLVDAPVELRRSRLTDNRGMTSEEASRMIEAQMPAEGKRAASRFVIENAGAIHDVERVEKY